MYYPIGLGFAAMESFEPWAHRIVNTFKREHPEVVMGHCGLDDKMGSAEVIVTFHAPIDGKTVAVKVVYTITKSRNIQPHTLSEPVYTPAVSCANGVWTANDIDIEPFVVAQKVPSIPVMSVPVDKSTLHRPLRKREVAVIDDEDD